MNGREDSPPRALAFFPWFTVETSTEVDSYQLVRWDKDQPDTLPNKLKAHHQIFAEIIGRYCNTGGGPIESATLLCSKDFDCFWPLDDSADQLLEFGQLLSCSELGKRQLFAHDGYVNRDTFRCVVQGFRPNEKGVVFRTRKRDGSLTNYLPDPPSEFCPPHVHTATKPLADKEFLLALTRAFKKSGTLGSRVLQSVYLYNLANTDGPAVNENLELVLLTSSFERLLDVNDGSPRTLGNALSRLFQDFDTLPTKRVTQARKIAHKIQKHSASIKEMWIRECFVERGMYAHGHRSASAATNAWSLKENLLLASFLLPLAIKVMLEREGYYVCSLLDRFEILSFDHRAAEPNLFHADGELSTLWPWNRAWEDCREEWCVRAALCSTKKQGDDMPYRIAFEQATRWAAEFRLTQILASGKDPEWRKGISHTDAAALVHANKLADAIVEVRLNDLWGLLKLQPQGQPNSFEQIIHLTATGVFHQIAVACRNGHMFVMKQIS